MEKVRREQVRIQRTPDSSPELRLFYWPDDSTYEIGNPKDSDDFFDIVKIYKGKINPCQEDEKENYDERSFYFTLFVAEKYDEYEMVVVRRDDIPYLEAIKGSLGHFDKAPELDQGAFLVPSGEIPDRWNMGALVPLVELELTGLKHEREFRSYRKYLD